MLRSILPAAATLGILFTQTGPARGDTWDINLARLCQIQTASGARLECGGGYTPQMADQDPLSGSGAVIPDNAAFRSLMSELGTVFAPNLLSPSDTLGYSGFSFSSEFAWTMINPKKSATDPILGQPRRFWRAAGSVSSIAYADPTVYNASRIEQELPPRFAPTITLMARKGLWAPLPSFELGIGMRHLLGSRMWGPTLAAKLALHEGFHSWPVPSLAVRGTATRVLGTPGFNLTVAGLDFSVAKKVGIASTFSLSPYLGYQLIWIVADSEVLDATPGIDAMGEAALQAGGDPMQLSQCRNTKLNDCWGNFTFADQSNITRHRFFLGFKANFYLASLLLEYTYFASGTTSDIIASQAGIPNLTIPDSSGKQHSISFALAVDY